MLEESITFCLLARNCYNNLSKNLEKIEYIRNYFLNSYVIVIENDSKDGTKDLLIDWQKNHKNYFIDCKDYNQSTFPVGQTKKSNAGASKYRIEKMAFFRNKYLEIIRKKNIHTDYITIFDSDLDDFAYKNFVSVIKNAPKDWSCIFANGCFYSSFLKYRKLLKPYDIFAYIPYNAEHDELTYKEMFINIDELERQLKKESYVRCTSAFGGIGIYHYDNIINTLYTTKNNERSSTLEVICEHISVNEYCKKFGVNYIAKDLYALYQRRRFLSPFMLFTNKQIVKLYEMIKRKSYPE
ncbi:glycosyltransferase family 2 protein [Treponema ruminis]|uniref:Glycosyltransferase 2-like domain-containing protein n=1 Tax=Treponema ruminis TaxID=744515 RepID=A0A7W8G9X9_9SPIR|nr:glycosyltransferase family A protein [Treponema ruminis]MBB5226584.1 hypothetical protein [Treponema ruminis]QSI02186.1 glycosyltransferase family 2 protein [Treponema ruminis]